MADFGLVTFKNEAAVNKGSSKKGSPVKKLFKLVVEKLFKAGLFNFHIFSRVYFFLVCKDLKNCTRTVKLFDNVNALIIEFPFTLKRCMQLNHFIVEQYIYRLCEYKMIKSCLLPGILRKAGDMGAGKSNAGISKFILKSLLVQIIDSIYSKTGLRIGILDIAIIAGDDEEELISIIRMLEPEIKFISVLSAKELKIPFECSLNEIFAETGLAINVTMEYRNTLKNAGLVINLADISEINNYKLHRKSLFINLHDSASGRLNGENALINGAVFEFADKSFKDFIYSNHNLYNKRELCEITLAHKMGLVEGKENLHDIAALIQKEYREGVFRITGFEGHRGIISFENLVKNMV